MRFKLDWAVADRQGTASSRQPRLAIGLHRLLQIELNDWLHGLGKTESERTPWAP